MTEKGTLQVVNPATGESIEEMKTMSSEELNVAAGDILVGLRVISTPGHTLGRVSLLRDEDGLCLQPTPSEAKRSAERLLKEDLGTTVLAHGKPLRAGAKELLRAAAARCDFV